MANGGILGPANVPTSTTATGIFNVDEVYAARKNSIWPLSTIPTSGLQLRLEAWNSSSYSGAGTTWTDLSGNSRNFTIDARAYNPRQLVPFMDFGGNYGMAKNSADFALSGAVTYVVWTRMKQWQGDWRTLTRSYVADHHVIGESGSWRIGMYDNNSNTYNDSGLTQNSLASHNTTQWVALYFRWATSSPFMTISYDNTPEIIRGSSTASASQYERGFGSIGGYHGENTTNPLIGFQFWGDISAFYVYNRALTDVELSQHFEANRARHGR
jgi:hypothetical protein